MKTTPTRAVLALASLALASTLGCRTTNPGMDHWNVQGVPARAAKQFLGYRADLDGDYRGFHVRQKQHINLTLRRHFLNNNPENPFQVADPNWSVGRPPHSLLPDPLFYLHFNPPFAVFASFLPGGGEEFLQGLAEPFRTGSYGGTLHLEPPPVEDFRVRRR